LHITGNPDVLTFTDYWGNKTGNFNLLRPHQELIIESKLIIQTAPNSIIHFPETTIGHTISDLQNLLLLQYSRSGTVSLASFLDVAIKEIYDDNKSISALAFACSEYIFNQFTYIKGITTVETTVEEIIEHKAGVCQDFAHVLLELLRAMKIPSRYVSGYICPNKNGMRGEGATHAWVEFYIPECGWVGLDPTNNVWVEGQHIKLAVGRDFADCTPVKGTFKGPAYQSLSVYVSIGYEDGMVFEEINDVQLEKTPNTNKENIIDNFAAQQQ
jgi:transglutaminase-like putative cysteine protease